MSDDEFLSDFEAATLPPERWTHEAHIRYAWLQLTAHAYPIALHRVRQGIRHYNAAHGKAGAYHDTITCAFVRLIASAMDATTCWTFQEFRRLHPELFDPYESVLLKYYSKATLLSDAARESFVEGDVARLPRLVEQAMPIGA
jgi:hypothetical protein